MFGLCNLEASSVFVAIDLVKADSGTYGSKSGWYPLTGLSGTVDVETRAIAFCSLVPHFEQQVQKHCLNGVIQSIRIHKSARVSGPDTMRIMVNDLLAEFEACCIPKCENLDALIGSIALGDVSRNADDYLRDSQEHVNGQGVERIRRENLSRLVRDCGGTRELGRKLNFKGGSYISQMLSDPPNRPISEKTARKIEKKLQLPLGWMDVYRSSDEHQSFAVPSESVQVDLLANVHCEVAAALNEESISLSGRKISNLVAMAYSDAVAVGAIDICRIKRLVLLMS